MLFRLEPEGETGPEEEIIKLDVEIKIGARDKRGDVTKTKVSMRVPDKIEHGEVGSKEILQTTRHIEPGSGVLGFDPF